MKGGINIEPTKSIKTQKCLFCYVINATDFDKLRKLPEYAFFKFKRCSRGHVSGY